MGDKKSPKKYNDKCKLFSRVHKFRIEDLILVFSNICYISLGNFLSSFKCWNKESEAILLENRRNVISHLTVNGITTDSIIYCAKNSPSL